MPRQMIRNACLSCRKKRTKCDGGCPCERCAARGSECTYQDRIWRTKDELRSEISTLQDGVSQVLSLLDAIARGNVDREAIQRIRQGNTVDGIVRSLGVDVGSAHGQINLQEKLLEIAARGLGSEAGDADGQSIGSASDAGRTKSEDLTAGEASKSRPSYTTDSSRTTSHVEDVLARSPFSISPFESPDTVTVSQPASSSTSKSTHISTDQPQLRPPIPATAEPSALPLHSHQAFDQPLPTGDSAISIHDSPPAPRQEYALDAPWSSISANPEAVESLVDTYFTWEHPGYSTVCKGPFLDDLRALRKRYCSEALVNAIMARSYQMMECAGEQVAHGLVDGLYSRAEAMLAVERTALETQYPHIQTLTVLSTVNIISGRVDHAWELAQYAAKLAIIDALHPTDIAPDKVYLSVRANTFCGTISLPCLLRIVSSKLDPMETPLFQRIRHDGSETPEARIERGILLQKHYHASLRHCPFRSQFIWEITELAHTFLMFHFDEISISRDKADLFETYPKLVDCLERATPELGTDNLDPGKLYNLIHYHFGMIVVFKPYIDDQTLEPALSPRMILATSTRAILELAWHHKVHWGLGLVHVGFSYIVGLATQVSVMLTKPSARSLSLVEPTETNEGPSSSEIACKGIMMLAELGPYHFPARNYLTSISNLYRW